MLIIIHVYILSHDCYLVVIAAQFNDLMEVIVVLLFSCLFGLTAGQGDLIKSIECPVPGDASSVTVTECMVYTACDWDAVSQKCHMRDNHEAGYSYSGAPLFNDHGFVVSIQKNDESRTMFGGDINQLQVMAIYHEDYHVQIKITDTMDSRYEVPIPLNMPSESGSNPMMNVYAGTSGKNLVLNVTRVDTGVEVFHTVGPLSFEDQFIQMTIRLNSKDLYGLGENQHSTLQRTFDTRTTYPMFNRDQAPVRGATTNGYGSFPYYINVEDAEGNTHSVLFLNSNAMEYSTFELSDGTPAITFRSTGGIIDMHIFAGPTPEDVNVQYASLVGKPMFPPYWSLGFHLSRWGYNNTDAVRAVRDRMKAAGIPQDVQTIDIDYMQEGKDFTVDPVNFGDLDILVEEMWSERVRTALNINPAIAINSSYDTFIRGDLAKAYIKWMSPDLVPEDQPSEAADYVVGYLNAVEKVVFADFMNPSTNDWWANEIAQFREQIPFQILWVDMDEPSNFGTNMEKPWNWPEGLEPWSLKCPENNLESPPYPTKATTQVENESQRISDRTLCMSSVHFDGMKNYTHYNVHNLYGYYETISTSKAMEALFPGTRPLVLSRSNFPGAGAHAGHPLGDNSATWEHLQDSIISILEFNMFGQPMVGADICGFLGEPTVELCARWMQLGAFYPFSRNHNAKGLPDQDPAAWPEVAAVSRDVLLNMRYKYLPYLYLLFHDAHMHGNSVVRPVFNVFPGDVAARSIGDQFFWGDSIMVAPVVQEGVSTRSVYFPQGLWYGLKSETLEATGNITLEVDAPFDTIPVYVRGGSIVPFQEPAINTNMSRLNDFGLLVAVDENIGASGRVFWDDGEKEHVMSETYGSDILFSNDQMVMTVSGNPSAAADVNLATIKYLGFPNEPTSVMVNGADVTSFTYFSPSQVLNLTVNLPLMNGFNILFSF